MIRWKLEALLILVLSVICVVLFHLLSIVPAGSSAPRLVFLYATCSLNKEYLSPYNRKVRYTPNIQALSEQSIVFTRHQSESAFSGAAYASLFTGSHVYQHGIYYHPAFLKDESYLIAEAFRDNGYETFYLNGHKMASAKLNFAQGIAPQNVTTAHLEKLEAILQHLQVAGDKKAYLQMNHTSTHAPYTGNSDVEATAMFCNNFPEECENVTKDDLIKFGSIYETHHVGFQYEYEKTIEDLNLNPDELRKLAKVVEVFYKSSVHLFDESFGQTMRLFKRYGLADRTMIVFTSDHGEVLFRDESTIKWTHSCPMKCLEPEALDIPLLIRIPNVGPAIYPKTTRAIDVFPTIAAFCLLKVPSIRSMDGQDLSRALLGPEQAPDLMSYSAVEVTHPGFHVEDLRKLIVQAREEDLLYRFEPLSNGASRLRILHWTKGATVPEPFDPMNPNHLRVQRDLRAYKERLIRDFKSTVNYTGWEEFKEELRSLGYLN